MAIGDTAHQHGVAETIGLSPVAVLATAWVYTVTVGWTLLGLVLAIPLLLLIELVTFWPFDRTVRQLVYIYGRVWMRLVRPVAPIQCDEALADSAPGPVVYVINHLSFIDTFYMAALRRPNISFAVRSWPFRMFWYYPFMKLSRYLDVESMPWDAIVAQARALFAGGGSLLFFPEGHRSRTGELGRFHSGAFELARQLGVPVVPLCITGTDRFLPPGRLWMLPAHITIRVLPPVDPGAFTGEMAHADLRRHVKRLMTENLAGMRAASRG